MRAATEEFAERGYEAASLRAIAHRAGVDPALVHYYFDDKADLFTAQLQAPFRPDKLVAEVLAGPREEYGHNVVSHLLAALNTPAAQRRAAGILRGVVGNRLVGGIVKEFLVREVFLKIAHELDTDDAELRATLAASQVLGLVITRYVLKVEPIASAPAAEIVARVGPVIQWHLVGYGQGSGLTPSRDE
ncbi:MAG TPA: TetR family transcriptional regulator [Terrimesophilobacter sp.]|nr:TetR family transcriptional regulator [Terrimesophilobacter sp.]